MNVFNKIITAKIKLSEIMEMDSTVPIEVQIRLKLNSLGFKFEDDGKPSAIVSRSPVPLGCFYEWIDLDTLEVNYKQVLE